MKHNGTLTPRFLAVSEVAMYLGISASMVYKLVKAGELRALKIGESWRVDKEALEAYISKRLAQQEGPQDVKPAQVLREESPPAPKDRGRKKTK